MTVRTPFRDAQWEALLDGIRAKECTPFLGAGLAAPALPTGGQLSEELSTEFGYPFRDCRNLPRVSQYLAVTRQDAIFPKRKVRDRILQAEEAALDLADADEPHSVLASLEVPIYLTTNYDALMTRALGRRHPGAVTREVARWNKEVQLRAGKFRASAPSPERPLVFHLHGHTDILSSMVLGEDDYVQFVTAVARDLRTVIPAVVQEALSWSSLLFVGYSLGDWNFHVLLRLLMNELAGGRSSRLNVSVQLPPDDDLVVPERRPDAEAFIADYLGTSSVHIHWGNARDFLRELAIKRSQ